jgi:hypothetical protein
MAFQLGLRRPSNPVIIATTGTVLLILLLFQIGRSHVPRGVSSFMAGAGKSSSLDDIFNSTLGVIYLLSSHLESLAHLVRFCSSKKYLLSPYRRGRIAVMEWYSLPPSVT